ncbi:NBS-LRR type resistance protein [Cucumis melo var. makuwa]|uniref:NBS-LRR type resistance protein n=1 Tax=Cucumis melo var. makuwa TaxID=1194695 RepID=A0A5D3BNI5_CUCMM|nr:NBS-LRR type resistance protein [Cucumis melo var. makuwa]TYK00665.1 NBS-LRR type resistance protein [Cucumis melo var. makuwa]
MTYARQYWVDDRATQKVLVGDSSRRLARRRVRAVPRRYIHSPQSIVELQLQAKLGQAMQQIKEQTRNHEVLVLEVE